MYTKDVPDQMTIRDEDGKEFETPCIGTSIVREVAAECEQAGLDISKTCVVAKGSEYSGTKCFFYEGIQNRTCYFTDGWTCHLDTGVCTRPIEYSGGRTITVKVNPNCADTTDTRWAFEVSCP
jgi:hypothetical protein